MVTIAVMSLLATVVLTLLSMFLLLRSKTGAKLREERRPKNVLADRQICPPNIFLPPLSSCRRLPTLSPAGLTRFAAVWKLTPSSFGSIGGAVMALWKDQYGREQNTPEPAAKEAKEAKETEKPLTAAPTSIETARQQSQAQPRTDSKESLIAAGLTIEGKIEGAGHVRIAGDFKGDVNVQGNLTIEAGARLTGGVKADTVIVGGQLDGNIDALPRRTTADRRVQR